MYQWGVECKEMNLKEEIFLKLNPYSPPENEKWGIHMTQEVIEIFGKRIDSRINKLVIGKGIVEFKDNLDVLEELQEIKEMLK